jgi:hypothetical protein
MLGPMTSRRTQLGGPAPNSVNVTPRLSSPPREAFVRHCPRRPRPVCADRLGPAAGSSWTGSATAIGSPSIRSRTTSRGCWRRSSTIRFRTWAPFSVRATPDTSPSRGIWSWSALIWALGRSGLVAVGADGRSAYGRHTRGDVARAGVASLSSSTINVATDTLAQVKLAALPPNVTVLLDGQPTGPVVPIPVGRHTITLTKT